MNKIPKKALVLVLFTLFTLNSAWANEYTFVESKVTADSFPADYSSALRIETDLKKSNIDSDSAFVYKTYALFDHALLPNKYKSANEPSCATSAVIELLKNWKDLRPETKVLLSDYFIQDVVGGNNIGLNVSYVIPSDLTETYILRRTILFIML